MNSQEVDRWFRNPGDLEVWEDIAAWFHQETGHLRPGKDKAPGFHQCVEGEPDCCHEAWLTWTEAKRLDAQRSLKAQRDRYRLGLVDALIAIQAGKHLAAEAIIHGALL